MHISFVNHAYLIDSLMQWEQSLALCLPVSHEIQFYANDVSNN